MYSCLLEGVISDYLLIKNSSKKWPIYSGYSLQKTALKVECLYNFFICMIELHFLFLQTWNISWSQDILGTMKLPRWRSCRKMALQSSAQMPKTNTQRMSVRLLPQSLIKIPLWHAVALMVSFSKISTVIYIKPFLDTYLRINIRCSYTFLLKAIWILSKSLARMIQPPVHRRAHSERSTFQLNSSDAALIRLKPCA